MPASSHQDLSSLPELGTRPYEEVEALPEVLCKLLKPWIVEIEKMEPKHRDLHAVEVFAREHWLTQKITEAGMYACAFDTSISKDHDIFSTLGFRTIVRGLLRVDKWGLCWGAPVCSSWGYIGRSSSGRSIDNPDGRLEYARVSLKIGRMVSASRPGARMEACAPWTRSQVPCCARCI